MTDESADWLPLKSAWQATTPLEQFAAGALRGSLRWRIWASRAWFWLEVASFLFLGFAVIMNLVHGQFAAGIQLGAVVAFCLTASVWARSGRLVGSLDSVPGMVDMTLSRTRKSLRIVIASYAVYALTAGAALGNAQTPFSDDDRLLGRLVLLVIATAVTGVYHLYLHARRRRFESIQRAFAQENAS